LAYSSNRSTNYYIVKLAFQDKYPIISLILRYFKKNKHADLAIVLQKIESHIFIEQISHNLIDNGIVPITIHDSIIVKESDLEKSEEIMNQVLLENIGFTPKIQVENLNDSKFKIKQKPLDIAAEINQLHVKRNVNKLLLQKTG
jgi:repressor of nif and glnA expression